MDYDYLLENLAVVLLALGLMSGIMYVWQGWYSYQTAALVLVPVGFLGIIVHARWYGTEGDGLEESRLGVAGSVLFMGALLAYSVGSLLAAVPGQSPYTVTLTTPTVETVIHWAVWLSLAGLAGVILAIAAEYDAGNDPAESHHEVPDDPTDILED